MLARSSATTPSLPPEFDSCGNMVGAASMTSWFRGDEIVGSTLSKPLLSCISFPISMRQTPSDVGSVDSTLIILPLAGNWSTPTMRRSSAILLFLLLPMRLRAVGLATC